MDDVLEHRTLHSIGNVEVKVKRIADYDTDLSWLGEFCQYREPQTEEQKLVHLATKLVLDHHGIWRDERGRIAPAPEDYRHSRNYQYSFHDNGHDKIRYAVHDSRRLQDFNDGSLGCIGVVASVLVDGVEVGNASLWGIDSDSGEEYIVDTEREEAREALKEARKWLGRRAS